MPAPTSEWLLGEGANKLEQTNMSSIVGRPSAAPADHQDGWALNGFPLFASSCGPLPDRPGKFLQIMGRAGVVGRNWPKLAETSWRQLSLMPRRSDWRSDGRRQADRFHLGLSAGRPARAGTKSAISLARPEAKPVERCVVAQQHTTGPVCFVHKEATKSAKCKKNRPRRAADSRSDEPAGRHVIDGPNRWIEIESFWARAGQQREPAG